MNYLTIPNLDRYQHYKDRKPPWMKLHASLLREYDFSLLDDAEKYQLIALWLLATQLDNKLPDNEQWLCKQIQAKKINLSKFKELHMVQQYASNTLASCKHSAIVEERHIDLEEEEKDMSIGVHKNNSKIPVNEIVELYYSILPELPKLAQLSDKRKTFVKQRWNKQLGTMKGWETYFNHVKKSDFLMGHVSAPPGRKHFKANFDFLINESNLLKIMEGYYHD